MLISTSSRVPNAQALVYVDVSNNNSVKFTVRSVSDLDFNIYVMKSVYFAFEKPILVGENTVPKKCMLCHPPISMMNMRRYFA